MANLSSQYSPIIFIDKIVAISSREKGGCAVFYEVAKNITSVLEGLEYLVPRLHSEPAAVSLSLLQCCPERKC